MISKAIATDASNSFPWQSDPLVSLDTCRDLGIKEKLPVDLSTVKVWSYNFLNQIKSISTYWQIKRFIKPLCSCCASQNGLSHRDVKIRVNVCTFPPEHRTLLDLDKIKIIPNSPNFECSTLYTVWQMLNLNSLKIVCSHVGFAINTNPKCYEDFFLSDWHSDCLTILHSWQGKSTDNNSDWLIMIFTQQSMPFSKQVKYTESLTFFHVRSEKNLLNELLLCINSFLLKTKSYVLQKSYLSFVLFQVHLCLYTRN